MEQLVYIFQEGILLSYILVYTFTGNILGNHPASLSLSNVYKIYWIYSRNPSGCYISLPIPILDIFQETTLLLYPCPYLYQIYSRKPPCCYILVYTYTGYVLGHHHAAISLSIPILDIFQETTLLLYPYLYWIYSRKPPCCYVLVHTYTRYILGTQPAAISLSIPILDIFQETTLLLYPCLYLYWIYSRKPPCCYILVYTYTRYILGTHPAAIFLSIPILDIFQETTLLLLFNSSNQRKINKKQNKVKLCLSFSAKKWIFTKFRHKNKLLKSCNVRFNNSKL